VSVKVRRVPGTDPVAVELIGAMVDEMGELYEPGLARSPLRPEELSPPGGGFLLLCEDGRALAGGGVKRLDERACEIKRMYVVPDARGRGVGRALLEALEDLARDLGYAVARLDTGAKQPGARRMYERAGFVSVPDYNDNPYAAFWGEKRLAHGMGDGVDGAAAAGGDGDDGAGAAGGADGERSAPGRGSP
jgi:GNAT superfamily N-acetyltransferase